MGAGLGLSPTLSPRVSVCVRVRAYTRAQSCRTLQPHSPPGSFVHGVSQARILEWVAISSSRGSS